MKIGLGINIFSNNFLNPPDPQALAHFTRVTSAPNNGVIPAGLNGLNTLVKSIKSAYSTNDVTSVLTAAYDPYYLGYKLGAGSGDALTQGTSTLYSLCGSDSDVTQGTTTAQPLFLNHDGTNNYWFSNGISNMAVFSDNSATVAGNISLEIIVRLSLNILSGTEATIISKLASNSGFRINYDASTDRIKFYKNASNVSSSATLTSAGITVHTPFFLKVTSVASTGLTQIFTSTNGVTYTQLGTDLSITTGNFLDPAGKRIGIAADVTSATASTSALKGKIYSATVATSINGTPVVNFNANGYPKTTAAYTTSTTWVASTGETWTINIGAGNIVGNNYNSILVHRSMLIGNGTSNFLENTTLTRSAQLTQYLAFAGFNNTPNGGSANTLDSLGVIRSNSIEQSSTTAMRAAVNGTGGGLITDGATTITKISPVLGLATFNVRAGTTPYSTALVNNILAKTDNVNRSPVTSTGLRILRGGSGAGLYAPSAISSVFISKAVDSAGIQTSMYNIIRGLNNNVF